MNPKYSFTVGTRNSRLVFWIFCCFTSFFLLNVHLIPTQIYGSTLSCVPPANLTNCEAQSTASTGASEPSETPLVLPDISPDRDDLTASTTPEGNLAANGLDLNEETISDANEIDRDEATNMDTDEDDQNQINDDDDESTDSGDRKSSSSDDSGPYLLPFP
jgi:hypothetical protein